MKRRKNPSSGATLGILAAIGLVGYFVWKSNKAKANSERANAIADAASQLSTDANAIEERARALVTSPLTVTRKINIIEAARAKHATYTVFKTDMQIRDSLIAAGKSRALIDRQRANIRISERAYQDADRVYRDAGGDAAYRAAGGDPRTLYNV
jgi:predicted negative regulator of RcsB-dependent stress response